MMNHRPSVPVRRWPAPRTAAAVAALLLLVPLAARANPEGGRVVRGEADITSAPGEVVVHQKSGKTVVEWNGFSVEGGEVTRFKQPDRHSIALNRVVGKDASRIDGRVEANGHVWVVNRNGVTVGPKGRVDATGFLATTADIDDDDFMAGHHRFAKPSPNPDARVVNQGTISLADQGLGALVAPHARNDGVIEGHMARVVIGGAETFTLDLYGDGLIQFDATSKVKQRPAGARALAENTGTIRADGGTVLITATAAAGVIEDAINMSGKVQARSFAATPGRIILRGGDEGVVRVTGELDASGAEPGARGGRVDIRGKRVLVGASARIDASGPAGGGEVLIGGDQGGGGPGPNAQDTVVMPGAQVAADARDAGRGGRVIVYADQTAKVHGNLSARGGPRGGDGGFVETSGKASLELGAAPDVGATAGVGGTWLIDPYDLRVDAAGNNSTVTDSVDGTDSRVFAPLVPGGSLTPLLLEQALSASANVVLSTEGTPTTGLGVITFVSAVQSSGAGSLWVAAAGGVRFTAALTLGGDLIVTAADGDILAGPGGVLDVTGDGRFTASRRIGLTSANQFGGAVTLNAAENADLVEAGAVTLAGGQIGGDLSVVSLDTTITQTGALRVAGTSTFQSPASILLDADNAFAGPVRLSASGGVSLNAAGPVQLGSVTADSLSVTAGGAITSAATLNVSFLASFVTRNDAGAPILLTDPDSSFYMLAARTLDATGTQTRAGSIDIRQAGFMDLLDVQTSGTASFTADGFLGIGAFDPMTAEGLPSQAGSLSLTANLYPIELPHIAVPGALSVQAAGPITQSGPLQVGGAAGFSALLGPIVLDDTGNAFGGPVSLAAGGTGGSTSPSDQSMLFSAAALQLGPITVAGDLAVTALGAISGTQAVIVDGAARFATRDAVGAPISLVAADSAFGTLEARSLDAEGNSVRGGGITIVESGTMDLAVVETTGAVTLLAGAIDGLTHIATDLTSLDLTATAAALTLPALTLPGTLSARAQGPITETGPLVVGGAAAFASDTALLLDRSDNDFGGVVTLAVGGTGPAVLVDRNALMLGASTLGGTLDVATLTDRLSLVGGVAAAGPVGLRAGGLLSLNAALGGATVDLIGGSGISAGPGGSLSAAAGLSALAPGGDILMADGARWQAGGPVAVQAQGSVSLGRIETGGSAIGVLAAGGVIADNTAGEGAGQENLVAADLTLRATAGIGTPGAGSIDIAAARLDAATGGGLYVAASGALQLGSQAPVSPGGTLEVSAGGGLSVPRGASVGGAADLILTTTAGDIRIGAELATGAGNLELIAAGTIQRTGDAVLRNRIDGLGTVSLCAGGAIGSPVSPILLDAAVVAARVRAPAGGIFLTQIDGVQGNLTIGTTPCACASPGLTTNNGDIVVLTLGAGQAPHYGRLDVLAPVTVTGRGDIWLETLSRNSDIRVEVRPFTDNGTVTIRPGRRTPGGGFQDGSGRTSVRGGFVTTDWTDLVFQWSDLWSGAFGSAADPPQLALLVAADAYAVPDFGDLDESESQYLSGGNADLWGPDTGSATDDERRREGGDETGEGAP